MNLEQPNLRIRDWEKNGREVFVCKGEDGYLITKEALRKIKFDFNLLKGKKVLIKPNAGRLVPPHLGINTNPEVIAGVIDFFLEVGVKNLAVGESPIIGVKAKESLAMSGIAKVAEERGIEIIDLDSDNPTVVNIPDWTIIEHLKICRAVVESDFIVSIPVMKTHMHTQVSLGLKNMKGCLYKREKVRLHQLSSSKKNISDIKPLDMAIADMAKVLLPDLVVIDGTIAQEGLGPSAGQPKRFGIVVSSLDCLSADWVAVELMGFNPKDVHHLRMAIAALNGNFKKVKVEPLDYKKWVAKFQPPPQKISFEFPKVVIEDIDSCSACLSTVLMFLKRYHKGFVDYFTEENPLRIALGKGIGAQPEKTLLIGNCASHRKNGCIFVKGCPPVASEILKSMERAWKWKR